MYRESEYLKIKGVEHLYPDEPIEKGVAHISKIVYKHEENPLYNLRLLIDGHGFATMEDGKYVRLHVNNVLVMSDTLMERRTNTVFVNAAHGKVLIAGLGIGLVLPLLIEKESVTEIRIIEKHQDVIDLVSQRFQSAKITYICEDIFNYRTLDKFNCIYFDIWSEITQDNLEDIRKLHNRFKFRLDRTDEHCFMDSWMKDFLQREKAKERRSSYNWW